MIIEGFLMGNGKDKNHKLKAVNHGEVKMARMAEIQFMDGKKGDWDNG